MSICFSQLNCKLGQEEILKNISGEISSGKMSAILGPNGCGKSTWLKALLGLVPLQAGLITGVSSNTGYLPQKKEIYWPLTCETIVNLGKNESELKATQSIMERLGLGHLREKRIDEVSGGERTLVLLARALRDKPRLIIADEPVAELDPKYQVRVMQILKEECLSGVTVLVTMHDIQLTAKFADEVYLMKNGKIVKQGDLTSVLSLENLQSIFETSFREKKVYCAE